MLRDRDIQTAEHFGIMDSIEHLKNDLMTIDGVIDVDFDLDGFWSNIHQVIFLTKYMLPMDGYYKARGKMVHNIIECACRHGLTRTGDPIEDHGSHLYFVTDCQWVKEESA